MFLKNYRNGSTKALNFKALIMDENTDTFSKGYCTFSTIQLIPTRKSLSRNPYYAPILKEARILSKCSICI